MPVRIAACVAAALPLLLALTGSAEAVDPDEHAKRPGWEKAPSVPATFLRDSYRPGEVARFVLWKRERAFTVQFFRIDPEAKGWRRTKMLGTPVSKIYSFHGIRPHVPISLRIGHWSSGLYFARLDSDGLDGVRALRRPPSASRRPPRARRASDLHLAGLQLP